MLSKSALLIMVWTSIESDRLNLLDHWMLVSVSASFERTSKQAATILTSSGYLVNIMESMIWATYCKLTSMAIRARFKIVHNSTWTFFYSVGNFSGSEKEARLGLWRGGRTWVVAWIRRVRTGSDICNTCVLANLAIELWGQSRKSLSPKIAHRLIRFPKRTV